MCCKCFCITHHMWKVMLIESKKITCPVLTPTCDSQNMFIQKSPILSPDLSSKEIRYDCNPHSQSMVVVLEFPRLIHCFLVTINHFHSILQNVLYNNPARLVGAKEKVRYLRPPIEFHAWIWVNKTGMLMMNWKGYKISMHRSYNCF